ncbi:hypothetical protein AN6500.2 [Aspergillus nidulans FGSC A4]|nr:hypothetical protein AN6500.2 [Aspergillus nidulans FGSC A4]|eukprot:XP_664104.1 hypothetical protein AN6500.2 [Aspergillus nidulans FGSC A4]
MAAERSNVSSDLVWQLTRNQNAYLVKRNTHGGVQFSRDPLNVLNKHSFKDKEKHPLTVTAMLVRWLLQHQGKSRKPLSMIKLSQEWVLTSNQAIGVQATENGGVVTITKKPGTSQQPAKSLAVVTYGPGASNRKIYKGVADRTAKNGYRADLRQEAVSRVSAIRRSQKAKKETPARKPRGAQARKAAEQESA